MVFKTQTPSPDKENIQPKTVSWGNPISHIQNDSKMPHTPPHTHTKPRNTYIFSSGRRKRSSEIITTPEGRRGSREEGEEEQEERKQEADLISSHWPKTPKKWIEHVVNLSNVKWKKYEAASKLSGCKHCTYSMNRAIVKALRKLQVRSESVREWLNVCMHTKGIGPYKYKQIDAQMEAAQAWMELGYSWGMLPGMALILL